MTFPCPECRKLLRAPEAHAGKSVRCPNCQVQFRTPAAPAASAATAPATPPVPRPPEPREDEPLSLPLADEDDKPAAVTPKAPNRVGPGPDDTLPETVDSDPDDSAEAEPARRKKKRRKKRRKKSDSLLDTFQYYTAAFGVFPWVVLGLLGAMVLLGGLSLLVPPVSLLLIGLGVAVYMSGYFWFVMVAFRDDLFHGYMCVLTHFYWFIYLFLNLEEAWRPTALMVLGILCSAIGVGILVAVSAPGV